MKIGIIIDHIGDLYCWQWIGQNNHEYIIYRDQHKQYSNHTTLGHYHATMEQGLDYLISHGVDQIICPPTAELHYYGNYPQILPIFQHYLIYCLQHSIVGKIAFIGSDVQCESINLHRGEFAAQHQTTTKQNNNRHYQPDLPIRTGHDHHLSQRLLDHNPKHYICNTLIKNLLRSVKDAAVDTIIGLDWSYYACDTSRTHHCRSIKRHRSKTLASITTKIPKLSSSSGTYSVAIHHTGTLRDLQANKKLWRMLARGKSIDIIQVKL